jgi:hypothetical protein
VVEKRRRPFKFVFDLSKFPSAVSLCPDSLLRAFYHRYERHCTKRRGTGRTAFSVGVDGLPDELWRSKSFSRIRASGTYGQVVHSVSGKLCRVHGV